MKHEFYEIEKVIGYKFKNRVLLLEALTHPSYANEHGLVSYDRLEFVGDSILDYVIADELYTRYKDKDEGELTKMRANIVSRDPLAYVVRKYNMRDYMLISGPEDRPMGAHELSNIFESLVAAIYYDGGMEASRRFILKFLSKNLEDTEIEDNDSKSMLQELVQELGLGKPTYTMLKHDFEDNIHTYTMQVAVGEHTATGEGKNMRSGEKIAARKMVEILKRKIKKENAR